MRSPHLQVSKSVKLLAILILGSLSTAAYYGVRSLDKLQTHYSVLEFLPAHHPALIMDQSVRDRFNITDRPVFIGVATLRETESGNWLSSSRMQGLEDFTKTLQKIEGVNEVIGINTIEAASDTAGSLNIGQLIKIVPPEFWAQRILKDHLLTPNLITPDGRTVLFYVQAQEANVELLVALQSKLKDALSASFPLAKTSVGGVPAVQADLGLLLNKELRNFLALSLLACALILFVVFRTLSTILIPLTLTAFANIMVLAIMAWTGLTFTILSSTIPILVFITVVALSTHMLLRVFEDSHALQPNETKLQLILRSNRAIWIPNILGALTTCVGFLTLVLGDVSLIRDYGVGVAMAVITSSVLTSIGIIPLMILFPLPEPRAWVYAPARWALWLVAKRKVVIVTVGIACVALFIAGLKLQWTGRLFDDLPRGQTTRETTEMIDHKMGGIVPLELMITQSTPEAWADPISIAKLEHLTKGFEKLKGVGSAHGIPDLLRSSGMGAGAQLPIDRKSIAEIYFLYSMGENNPLKQFLTVDGQSARIEMRLHDLPSNKVHALLAEIQKKTQSEFPNAKIQMGGMGAVIHSIYDELCTDLIFGFWQAMVLIVILLTVIFRSLKWALVACLPNLVPPIVLLGYLGLTHTPIKPGVAIIFSIALGLAFNNTVYVLNRMRTLMKPDRKLPVAKTFYTEGNPCLVSTLVVFVGFAVFLFSYFPLNVTFGACMLVSIVGGLIGDLVFLPALLAAFPNLLPNFHPKSKVRAYRRRPIEGTVSLMCDGYIYQAPLRSIGQGGLGTGAVAGIKAGSKVNIVIASPTLGAPLQAKAVVQYSDSRVLGLQFTTLELSDRGILAEHVAAAL
jgi:predicted RND superfamily exporter protein